MHEAARRVIDEHEQRALWAAVFEPPMLGPVDLHEFTDAVTAVTRLVHGLEPLPSVPPEAVGPHPLPDRLDPKMDAVPLGQLLAGEGWTEVGVVGLDQPQRLRSERRRIAAVAGLAAAGRNQRRRPTLPIRFGQPEHVAARQPHQLGSLIGRNPASRQIPEHVHPVDLSAAHRNHRHQTRAPQHRHDVARRVTSETGRGVTFLSGVYTRKLSHEAIIGTFVGLILVIGVWEGQFLGLLVIITMGLIGGLLYRNIGFNTGVQFMGYYAAVLTVPALTKLITGS